MAEGRLPAEEHSGHLDAIYSARRRPVLHITGTCVMGGIDVRRKARRQRKEKGRMPRIEQ